MSDQQLKDEIERLKTVLRRQDDERWEELRRDIHSMAKSIRAIELTLNGPPDKAEAGLKVRVDRLERSEKERKWWFRASIGASLGAIASGAWAYLTTYKQGP